jgi:hypothetical protein
LKTFLAVGEALITIRDNKLYRGTHDTFEAYCTEKWNITRGRGYQLMDAAKVVKSMKEAGASEKELPKTEGEAREKLKAAKKQSKTSKPTGKQLRDTKKESKARPNGNRKPAAVSINYSFENFVREVLTAWQGRAEDYLVANNELTAKQLVDETNSFTNKWFRAYTQKQEGKKAIEATKLQVLKQAA